MKKKLFLTLIFTFLITISFKVAFAADMKYIYKTHNELTKGVTLTQYEIFMSDRRWNKVYVASADLNYPHLSLKLSTSENGVSYLTKTTDMAAKDDATVTINADFFNRGSKSGSGSPIGAVYFSKKMLSSPSYTDGMYTIMQDINRNVFADIVDYKITICAPNGEKKQIAGKNKTSDLSQIMMYDNNYDEYSLGSTQTLYEMVVEDGKVKEIRFESEPIKLLDNMYVLCALSDHDTFLLDNFQVGDTVEIEEISNTDFSKLNLAVGAGAKLVDEGNIVKNFSHVISGTNPRTALGISKNKRTVYFVVADGRSQQSSGMSMDELASFMQYIGSYNALNLDGGGSSTMVAKNLQDSSWQLVNTPSDSAERKVTNALSILSSVKSPSSLYHLELSADGENVFKNSRINLNVEGFDEYYFPVKINKNNITYSVSGVNGYFEDSAFFPTTSGIATITARMPNGANASITLRVLDRAYKIENEQRIVNIDVRDKKKFTLYVLDENGYGANVPLCDMKVNFSENIAHIDFDSIIADRSGSVLMSISFGDAVTYSNINVGESQNALKLPSDKTAHDSKDKSGTSPDNDVKTRFAVFGNLRESDTLFNNLIMKKSLSKIDSIAHQLFVLSTNTTENIKPNIKIPVNSCYPYTSFIKDNDKYIILDSEDNFMSAKEWTWFIDEVNNTKNSNMFVFMQTDAEFTQKKETKLLKDVLSEAANRGINVYVFCQGADNLISPENGVRYIKTPGFSDDINSKNFISLSSKLQYILVDVEKNGEVSYRFMPIY